MKKITPQTIYDLTPEQEYEYMMWFGFLREFIDNALIQIGRWKQDHHAWDLQMFFTACVCIYDATDGLVKFLANDKEFKDILKLFKRTADGLHIRDFRDDSLHREGITKKQDKHKKPLNLGNIIILGGYNYSTDTFTFGDKNIKVNESFLLVDLLHKRMHDLLDKRRQIFFKSKDMKKVQGMIPYSWLYYF